MTFVVHGFAASEFFCPQCEDEEIPDDEKKRRIVSDFSAHIFLADPTYDDPIRCHSSILPTIEILDTDNPDSIGEKLR